jgi:hypothetical protein
MFTAFFRLPAILLGMVVLAPLASIAKADEGGSRIGCRGLPTYPQLKAALEAAVQTETSGLNNHMWATIVNRDGIVCAVAFSGTDRSAQWPGSRVISAQKANTANGPSTNYGTPNDPLVGAKVGGVNVFGGGLGLYDIVPNPSGGTGNSVGGFGHPMCLNTFGSELLPPVR